MRTSDPLLLTATLLLAGCSGGTEQQQASGDGQAVQPKQNPGLAIDCALAGAQSFARDCTVEQADGGDAVILTLRHPDGGFRRLQVTHDGRGVAAADGALPARISVEGDREIGIVVGDDRYRLPATIGAK
ncbi:hypothetical protein [Sphingomonas sp.]|uniref:hypothetical protein n=1 Tax=Sphingomonas sp. TaxID=28214 RepID=UPI0031D808F9